MDENETVNPQITQSALAQNYNLPSHVIGELIKYNWDPLTFCTLKNTLYPGVKDDIILMILSYCAHAKLDPLQKLVHVVPMKGKDVIMPGIGLYRVQAVRTGAYAGIEEPEFGNDITTDIGGVKLTYPAWCKIKIKKLVQGEIFEFTAKEYWLENYATAYNSVAPNTMWAKRPYGQLAKCAEAQALRKAFPEAVSQAPTLEEMEGKNFVESHLKADNFREVYTTSSNIIDSVVPEIVKSDDMLEKLNNLIHDKNVAETTLNSWCKKANVSTVNELPLETIIKCIEYLETK